MRSFFLPPKDWAKFIKEKSQSLLNEVFFPTVEGQGKEEKMKALSQSLLNEVFFPTEITKTGDGRVGITQSQSLLNEVFFPTGLGGRGAFGFASQSLLNEVFFPTSSFTAESSHPKSRNPF